MYRIIVLLTLSLSSILAHDPFVGLRFADSTSSYILIKPDMHPVQEKISICAWVHKMKSGHYPTVLRYNAPSANADIIIRDTSFFYMFQQKYATDNTAPLNQWHHRCLTWSLASQATKVYYNGKLIKTVTSPSGRRLAMGGSIAIGSGHKTTTLQATIYPLDPLGGELFKLNVFSRQLTDEEISEMHGSGMCSDYEESLAEDTFLSWDTLLSDTPLHNVEKFNITECSDHTHQEPTESATTEVTEAAETKTNSTTDYRHWNILYSTDFYNKVS